MKSAPRPAGMAYVGADLFNKYGVKPNTVSKPNNERHVSLVLASTTGVCGFEPSVSNNENLGERIFGANKKMQLKPLDDRVVVRVMEAETTTAGGIVLPDAAQEKPQRGEVVAVGPGRLLESGERAELSVAVGDKVLYGKYGGTDIEVDGQEVMVLRESDILAKIVS